MDVHILRVSAKDVMTTSINNTPAQAMPPNVHITFRDDFTGPERRNAVERSVSTLVSRSAEAFAAETAREKLLAAVDAPLIRLIKDDPGAAKALDELREQQVTDLKFANELFDFEPRDIQHRVSFIDDLAKLLIPTAHGLSKSGVLAMRPPYDFAWSWFDTRGGAPLKQTTNNSIGRIVIDARSIGRYVFAHAGFGLLLTTDAETQATGYASCRARWEILLEPLVGSNGAVGWMEFTALEDGRLLASAPSGTFPSSYSEAVFDHKVRAPARFSERSGPEDVLNPRELAFTMRPGREYTFNVGLVVFANSGEGAASGFIDGDLGYIAIVHR